MKPIESVLRPGYGMEPSVLAKVEGRMAVKITPFLRKRDRETVAGTEIGKEYPLSKEALGQWIPDESELVVANGFVVDPTNEHDHHPVPGNPGIIQVHDERALLLPTDKCVVHCRYCFRFPEIGQGAEVNREGMLDYLRENRQINEVIVSGGDPLAESSRVMIPFLRELSGLDSVKKIRLDTRVPNTAPSVLRRTLVENENGVWTNRKVDSELLKFLKEEGRNKHGISKFSVYTQMNHPDELHHPDVYDVVKELLGAGINVLNQAVILGGVNTNPDTVKRLWRQGDENGIEPSDYYMPDFVSGTTKFHVPDDKIVELYSAVGTLGGRAVPSLVYVGSDDLKYKIKTTDRKKVAEFVRERRNHFTGSSAIPVFQAKN